MIKRIKVKPGSFKNEFYIDENENWVVKLKAKPIDGVANEQLIEYLAAIFKSRKSSITIEKGHTSQYKTINIDEDTAMLNERINQLQRERNSIK
ncbi:MAG: DUF167 domain-containing protein [Bacteroidota bacterium]|nr:DUF167 domain-containing protein [Bacteroidota bacterium]